jgi:hypothetical protein
MLAAKDAEPLLEGYDMLVRSLKRLLFALQKRA